MSILRDLENLLREIAEAQQPGAGRPAAPPVRPAPKPAGAPRPDASPSVEVLDADIVEAEPVRRKTGTRPGAKQTDSRGDARGAEPRGAEIGRIDVQTDSSFHDKFDQQKSRIDDPDDKAGAAAGAAFATRIVGMFRDPQSIQQAFILNEILNRPEGRW